LLSEARGNCPIHRQNRVLFDRAISHTAAVVGIAFSPDGARLVTASADQTAKLCAVRTGKELFTL
jgi:WD40 repeat protein